MPEVTRGVESRKLHIPWLSDMLSKNKNPLASPQSPSVATDSPHTAASTGGWLFGFLTPQVSVSTPQVPQSASGSLTTAANVAQSPREIRSENGVTNSHNGVLPTTADVSAPSPATLATDQRQDEVDDAALDGLRNILQGLHDCSKFFSALQAADGAWRITYTTVKEITGRSEEFEALETELAAVLSIVKYYKKPGTTYALNQTIDNFCTAIILQIRRVENLSGRFNLKATWTGEDKEAAYSVMNAFRNISALCSSFQVNAQPHVEASILSVQVGLSAITTSFFPNAHGVTMNQPVMHDYSVNVTGTERDFFHDLKDHHLTSAEYDFQELGYETEPRTDVVRVISEWADGADDRPICWLYGPAGSGKSMVARAIAERYHEKERLAGSFFFSRGYSEQENTAKLITTIAYRLGTYHSAVAESIRQILKADPSTPARSLKIQLDHLIMTPVRSLQPSLPLIVVIDALDECNAKESVEVVEVLNRIIHDSPPLVRFFITGRADDDLLGNFKYHSEKACRLDLADFPPRDALRAFYAKRLEELFDKNSGLMTTADVTKPWPTNSDRDKLVDLSNGLFIHAATIVKFVGDFKAGNDSPTKRLVRAMERHDGLDDLYRQVLQDAPNHAKEPFARVLGTLLLLRDPLSVDDLACLLRVQVENIFIPLTGCRSILRIPDGGEDAITFFHASLRDFLLDEERAGLYYIDSARYHTFILEDCIWTMTREWDQKTMGTWDGGRTGRVLVYACNNWHYHLGEVIRDDRWTSRRQDLRSSITADFQKNLARFLKNIGTHWYEMWAAIVNRDYDTGRTLREDLVVLCDMVKARNFTPPRMHGLLQNLVTRIEASSQTSQDEVSMSLSPVAGLAGETGM